MAERMNFDPAAMLIAVDIGNSRIKLGQFAAAPRDGLPVPERALSLDGWQPERVEAWLGPASSARQWRICSVNRPLAGELVRWLDARPGESHRLLTAAELPLVVSVERPDLVGIDRLVGAIAANRLRPADKPAIVIDVGTAITVDLVSAAGAFLGGAILPGISLAARALHDRTDLLPLIPMSDLDTPPPALGTATLSALRSGLYWGAVGAMRELIARLSAGLPSPVVYLTGGAAPAVAALLTSQSGQPAEHVPHLTLGGVALAEVASPPR